MIINTQVDIHEQEQQETHPFLIIYFNYIILEMFRTNNCLSSGGYEESSR